LPGNEKGKGGGGRAGSGVIVISCGGVYKYALAGLLLVCRVSGFRKLVRSWELILNEEVLFRKIRTVHLAMPTPRFLFQGNFLHILGNPISAITRPYPAHISWWHLMWRDLRCVGCDGSGLIDWRGIGGFHEPIGAIISPSTPETGDLSI